MDKIRPLGFLLLGLFLLESSSVFAARPLLTEDAKTLEKRAIELEMAFDFLRDENHDNNYIPSAQLKYGLMARTEVGASFGYTHREEALAGNADGWSDLLFYVKHQLREEGKYFPAIAFKPQVKFPTASREKGLGSGKTDYGFGPIFSKSFSDFRLHFDAFYFVIGEKGKTDVLNTGLAMEYEFRKSWAVVGEVRYANNFNSDHQDDPLRANFGLKKEIGRAVFDAAFNVGLNNAAPDYGFTVGVTIGF